MTFEFSLATRGAEVVFLSFKVYPEICFFRQAQRRTQDLSINDPTFSDEGTI